MKYTPEQISELLTLGLTLLAMIAAYLIQCYVEYRHDMKENAKLFLDRTNEDIIRTVQENLENTVTD